MTQKSSNVDVKLTDDKIVIKRTVIEEFTNDEFNEFFEGLLLDIRREEDEVKNVRRGLEQREQSITDARKTVATLRESYRETKQRGNNTNSLNP